MPSSADTLKPRGSLYEPPNFAFQRAFRAMLIGKPPPGEAVGRIARRSAERCLSDLVSVRGGPVLAVTLDCSIATRGPVLQQFFAQSTEMLGRSCDSRADQVFFKGNKRLALNLENRTGKR
jgi:hypothetical protein